MAEEVAGAPVSEEVTDDDKLWGALCWVPFIGWIICIIVLLMEDKKARPFIKYNAVIGLAFAVVWGVAGAITLGCIGILGAIYAVYLAIQAYQGEWVEVPFLTDFCKNQGWV